MKVRVKVRRAWFTSKGRRSAPKYQPILTPPVCLVVLEMHPHLASSRSRPSSGACVVIAYWCGVGLA